MDLVQFDPFSLLRDFDRAFDRGRNATSWIPRVDVFDRGEDIVVRMEVAGIDPADIDITLEDRTLSISGTRRTDEEVQEASWHRREILTGEFTRTLVLPKGLDAEEIKAHADNGILEVTLPRTPEVLPRKVKVDIG
jgi:HSP20 family protein